MIRLVRFAQFIYFNILPLVALTFIGWSWYANHLAEAEYDEATVAVIAYEQFVLEDDTPFYDDPARTPDGHLCVTIEEHDVATIEKAITLAEAAVRAARQAYSAEMAILNSRHRRIVELWNAVTLFDTELSFLQFLEPQAQQNVGRQFCYELPRPDPAI